MTADQSVRLLEITQRKTAELFEELMAELTGAATEVDALPDAEAADPVAVEAASNGDRWSLDAAPLSGDWVETGRPEGETYDWPDGNHDEYSQFVSYRGTGDYEGVTLGLGYLDYGDVVGFVLGPWGKRGITWFYQADDFDQTNEKISFIRGNGPNGRSGWAPEEPLPTAYRGFKTDVLARRKAGKWNRLGVVAKESDYKTMLGHTFLQARLRALV